MKLNHYRFGHIEVDGISYSADLIVTPERVHHNWRRKTGHNLATEDLDAVVAAKPDMVVIGSGFYGRMQVPKQTRDFLQAKGIKLQVAQTTEAVEIFNRLQRDYARVVAAFHLTC